MIGVTFPTDVTLRAVMIMSRYRHMTHCCPPRMARISLASGSVREAKFLSHKKSCHPQSLCGGVTSAWHMAQSVAFRETITGESSVNMAWVVLMPHRACVVVRATVSCCPLSVLNGRSAHHSPTVSLNNPCESAQGCRCNGGGDAVAVQVPNHGVTAECQHNDSLLTTSLFTYHDTRMG